LFSGKLRRRNTSNSRNRLAAAFRKSLFNMQHQAHVHQQLQHLQQLHQLHQMNPALAAASAHLPLPGSLPPHLSNPNLTINPISSLPNALSNSLSSAASASSARLAHVSSSAVASMTATTPKSMMAAATHAHQQSLTNPFAAHLHAQSQHPSVSFASALSLTNPASIATTMASQTALHPLHSSLHLQPFLRSLSAAAAAAAAAASHATHHSTMPGATLPVGSPAPTLCSPHSSTGSSATHSTLTLGASHTSTPFACSTASTLAAFGVRPSSSRSSHSQLDDTVDDIDCIDHDLDDEPIDDDDDDDNRSRIDINVEDDDDDEDIDTIADYIGDPNQMYQVLNKLNATRSPTNLTSKVVTPSSPRSSVAHIRPSSQSAIECQPSKAFVNRSSTSGAAPVSASLSAAFTAVATAVTLSSSNIQNAAALFAQPTVPPPPQPSSSSSTTTTTTGPPPAHSSSSATSSTASSTTFTLTSNSPINFASLSQMSSLSSLPALARFAPFAGLPSLPAALTSLPNLPNLNSALAHLPNRPFPLYSPSHPSLSPNQPSPSLLSLSADSLNSLTALTRSNGSHHPHHHPLPPHPLSMWPFHFDCGKPSSLATAAPSLPTSNSALSKLSVSQLLAKPEAKSAI
jgi:hypothetical protein